jgi:hypothetical protein
MVLQDVFVMTDTVDQLIAGVILIGVLDGHGGGDSDLDDHTTGVRCPRTTARTGE